MGPPPAGAPAVAVPVSVPSEDPIPFGMKQWQLPAVSAAEALPQTMDPRLCHTGGTRRCQANPSKAPCALRAAGTPHRPPHHLRLQQPPGITHPKSEILSPKARSYPEQAEAQAAPPMPPAPEASPGPFWKQS